MADTKEKSKNIGLQLNEEEMAQAGLHFGHHTSKIHPKMEQFLFGVRNSIHLIDLEKTKEKLEEVLKFIQNLVSEGKIMIFVGTKIQAKEAVRETAEICGFPYVTERWLGGTFTNFDILKKRITYLKDLEKQKNEGELEKYTKKERANIEKKIKELEKKFGGLKNLENLPDAILVLDMKKDILAVKEAKMKGIKVIGVSDTNIDPTLADYVIPANDDAVSSVKYVLEKVKEVVLKSKPKV